MYCVAKRVFDLFFAVAGLVVLSPLLFLVGIAIWATDGCPILFRQQRVGQGGTPFTMLKFRSMAIGAEKAGPAITVDGDRRITRIGRCMRRTKLDELPQLWNVLVGDMSFVGPRPEVPKYVEKYTAEQRRVLALRPGITDLATLKFRNEEALLAKAVQEARRRENGLQKSPAAEAEKQVAGDAKHAEEVEKCYLEYCVPRKIQLSLAYAQRSNLWSDVVIIFQTIFPMGARKGAGANEEIDLNRQVE